MNILLYIYQLLNPNTMRFKDRVEKDLTTVKRDLKEIKELFLLTNQKLEQMSKANDQVLAIVSEMNEETNDLSARIDKFIADEAAKADTTVTPEAIAGLQAVSARLKSLGADPAEPIPAPVPDETPVDVPPAPPVDEMPPTEEPA